VHIRRASVTDAESLASVHVQSWQAAYRGLLPQAYLDGLAPADRLGRWIEHVRDADWPQEATYVADEADGIVGFVHVGPSRDSDAAGSGELRSIYVLPQTWSSGVGRQLAATGLESLRGAGFLLATLWVLEGNSRAIRFYEVGGWRHDGAWKTNHIGGLDIVELRYRRTLS
jgi:GNAT superfamily N-acetyltransferase